MGSSPFMSPFLKLSDSDRVPQTSTAAQLYTPVPPLSSPAVRDSEDSRGSLAVFASLCQQPYQR